ncbi:hypothetical protein VIBNISOn1_1540073 [Vibrio nigripulchritudo SOn1]|uniref:Uncharacterized protein n=1 Tax=Vibrio nigripulchritudo SOn1 TaxID=1238450 RepID=A0AAV2VM48_9VIBR|nr:hypothetical protein VIBNISOn1_1540073 [Vibrio nigripulchritudo SOn1]
MSKHQQTQRLLHPIEVLVMSFVMVDEVYLLQFRNHLIVLLTRRALVAKF